MYTARWTSCFSSFRTTGSPVAPLTSSLSLVDRGIVSVDVLIVGKDKTGATYGVDFAEVAAEQLRGSPSWPGPGRGSHRRGHAPGGRGHGTRTTRSAHRLREHLGDPLRRCRPGVGRRADRRCAAPRAGRGRPGRTGVPGQTHHHDEARSRNAWITARSGTDSKSSPGQPPQSAVACNADRRADSLSATRSWPPIAPGPTRPRWHRHKPNTSSRPAAGALQRLRQTRAAQDLADLKAQGVLTEEEFAREKAKILGG